MEVPLVSVLMTAYNRELFIGEAIDSVLASSYTNFELIIVDDLSTDNTINIIQQYALKDTRIKLFLNKQNLGDYPNRNRAASYALGELLMSVDSDDMLLKDSMKNTVSLMHQFPEVKFGISDLFSKSPVVLDSSVVIKNHFFKKPILMKGPGGTIIHRSFFNQIGGYPEKYGPANDMYFNLKAASKTNVLLIPFEFIFYRRHAGQEINNSHSYLYNSYRYQRDALNELNMPLSKKEEEWLHRKNKRRFVVNICKYLFNTFSISKTYTAIKLAEFSFRDFIQGILH